MSDDEEWDVTLEDLEDDAADQPQGPADEPRGSADVKLSRHVRTATALLTTRSGLQLFALMTVVGLVGTVVNQTVLTEWIGYLRTSTSGESMVQFLPPVSAYPLAVDAPIAPVAALALLIPFVMEALRIVAIRAFDADATDGIPLDLARGNLLWAVFRGWLGGVLLLLGVSLGLVLVLPGVYLAVATIFYHQEVALQDESILGALRGSWSLTAGHRWDLLRIVVALAGLWVVTSIPTFLLPVTSVAGPLVALVLTQLAMVFSIALVTDAYGQLRGSQTGH